MDKKAQAYIESFFEMHGNLWGIHQDIYTSIKILTDAYRQGNKVMVCGNGGSASDSEHIVGELMKGFLLNRIIPEEDREKICKICDKEIGEKICNNLQGALPAISLTSHTALMTAFLNDVEPQMIFAQQVYGYGKPGDVLICISTSGNSKDVYYAAVLAKAFDMKVIALTGKKASSLSDIVDVLLRSPQERTFLIQEDHLKIYHLLCGAVELELYRE